MKAIMVMFDSLNRKYLPNYGETMLEMPNFSRLSEKAVTFDQCYAGSLPCMPARRELHTGRLNFLHRGWCPLEPFDDSMPELLKHHGIYTHLISDHQHYWEDGGATYHTRYSSWECERGQEGDPWKCDLHFKAEDHKSQLGNIPKDFTGKNMRQHDCVNRSYIRKAVDFPQARTFCDGIEFIRKNHDMDQWFLQIETFDPHEPFYLPEEYIKKYSEKGLEISEYDWPPYGPVTEGKELVEGIRNRYRVLLEMCDDHLGKILDLMDQYNLWEDTMLIVNTDHGYLLGEHLWWSKGVMPMYDEIAHLPLFIWDPRSKKQGERRKSLVQTIDLAPTILNYFHVPVPEDMQGFDLGRVIREDTPVRTYALFGIFGSMINITDGRYVYMRSPQSYYDHPLNEYTLMPTSMRARIQPEQLKNLKLHEAFSFTKGCPVLQIPTKEQWNGGAYCYRYGNVLYDVGVDAQQSTPVENAEVEARMVNAMAELMKENDAPDEQFIRMGIPENGRMTEEDILREKEERKNCNPLEDLDFCDWSEESRWQFMTLCRMMGEEIKEKFRDYIRKRKIGYVQKEDIYQFADEIFPENIRQEGLYTLELASRLY